MPHVARNVLYRQQGNLSLAGGLIVAAVGSYTAYSYFIGPESVQSKTPTSTFRGGPGFTSLRLHSIETLSHDTKRFRFELPEKEAVSGLSLTSALLTLSRPQGHILPAIRPYTPVSDLDEPGFIELVVKRYPNGKASNHIHSLTPGQSLSFLGSIKGYSWKVNEVSSILLIAGGAGITPMYQLIRGIFKNPEEKTKVTLVFGINSDADALFQQEFAQYEKEFPDRFKVTYTVSNPAPDSLFHKGYISKQLLAEAMPNSAGNDTKVFMCGPPAMEASILGTGGRREKSQGGILGELGFTKDQVVKF